MPAKRTSLSSTTIQFIERWNQKAENHPLDDENLANYFDQFISRFITFNVLYNHVSKNLFKWDTKEINRATDQVVAFLGEREIMDQLKHVHVEVLRILREGHFVIVDTSYDTDKLRKPMASDNQKEQAEGLLKFLYKVRCNIFHGDKSFEAHQMKILKPSIEIVKTLNQMLKDKLAA